VQFDAFSTQTRGPGLGSQLTGLVENLVDALDKLTAQDQVSELQAQSIDPDPYIHLLDPDRDLLSLVSFHSLHWKTPTIPGAGDVAEGHGADARVR
jgi:hypothetical protein